MGKSPLAVMKGKYGAKDKLVDKLAGKLEPFEGESKDDLKTRLTKVSSKKLMRLQEVEEKVEELFGSKDKLVDALLALERPNAKKVDRDYRNALAKKSKSELLMLHGSAARRAKARTAASKAASKR
jgi:hypothetical protein